MNTIELRRVLGTTSLALALSFGAATVTAAQQEPFTIAVVLGVESAGVFDFERAELLGEVPLGGTVVDAAMSPDGRYAYIATESGQPASTASDARLRRLDLETLKVDATLRLPNDAQQGTSDLEISPDGRWLAHTTPAVPAFLTLIDTTTLRAQRVLLCADCPPPAADGAALPSHQIAFSEDGSRAYKELLQPYGLNILDTTTLESEVVEIRNLRRIYVQGDTSVKEADY